MSNTTGEDQFLDAATAGLKHDRELQLDVRAELKAHLEDRRLAAKQAGAMPEAAAEEALKAMGSAPELAADLEQSNRKRMRLRGLVRLAATWLLAPLAVAIAVVTTNLSGYNRLLRMLIPNSSINGDSSPQLDRQGLTPDQRLVLLGDPARPTRVERERAIWERWPTNKVYLHNYISCLYALRMSPGQSAATAAEKIGELQPLDPDNARFDYLLAALLLNQAVNREKHEVKGIDGNNKIESAYTIRDRAKLDKAMALFKAGLSKPVFRRYEGEMKAERLEILGKPNSLLQETEQFSVVAGVWKPEVSFFLELQDASLFYGELLLKEGRKSEADIFLNGYRKLVKQITPDSFSLMDWIVAGVLAERGGERLANILEAQGDVAAAESVRAETAELAAPIKAWRARQKAKETNPAERMFKKTLKRHMGILSSLLMTSFNFQEYPSVEELAPSRLLEYVVAEGAALIFLSAVLFLIMILCVMMALWYRLRGGRRCALLLLPQIGEVAHMLGLAILLPILAYYLLTRWMPWSGRGISLVFGFSPFFVQIGALILIMLGILGTLASRLVRRRCRELLLPVPPPSSKRWRIGMWGMIALIAVAASTWPLWIEPESLLWIEPDSLELNRVVFWPVASLLLPIIAWLIHRLVREIKYGRAFVTYYGSLVRTLLPVLALALILVNVCSWPYLRFEERRLVEADTLIKPDPSGGVTSVESRITQRLKTEMEKAVDSVLSK